MKKVLIYCFLIFFKIIYAQESTIDFSKYGDGERWEIVNDGVMGGFSQGNYRFTDGGVVFEGKISLENNGGFSSFKSNFQKRDLSSFSKVIIRYRSKKCAIGFTLELDKRWFVPYYKADLPSTQWKWKEIEIPFSDFIRYNIGRKRKGKISNEELQNILRIGFITNEKRATSFKIEVDYIKFE